jgi:hypothetical protein
MNYKVSSRHDLRLARRPCPRWVVVVAMSLVGLVCPVLASAGTPLKSCGVRTYSGGGPGFATIIERLRVRGVTCRRATTVAGRAINSNGRSVPGGWRCRLTSFPSVCVRGRARITFVSGGDAG